MAFGFPAAYYSVRIDLDVDRQSVREAIIHALNTLGWRYENPHSDLFYAKVPISGSSWGEKMTIGFTEDGQIEIESRCAPFPQMFDWGKNRKNVEQFLDLMVVKAEMSSKIRSLTDPPFDTADSTPLERAISGDERASR